ncbi:hypothetical protein CRG98_014761, partial [Punica granatum]
KSRWKWVWGDPGFSRPFRMGSQKMIVVGQPLPNHRKRVVLGTIYAQVRVSVARSPSLSSATPPPSGLLLRLQTERQFIGGYIHSRELLCHLYIGGRLCEIRVRGVRGYIHSRELLCHLYIGGRLCEIRVRASFKIANSQLFSLLPADSLRPRHTEQTAAPMR